MLEKAQRVVSNTTPIITLSVIGRLNLLRDLYAEVLIPPAPRTPGILEGDTVYWYWIGKHLDVKGDIYEGLLEKYAQNIKSGAASTSPGGR